MSPDYRPEWLIRSPKNGTVRHTALVAALDPELPVFAAKTMAELTDDSLVTRRWPVLLSMGFGVVALPLEFEGASARRYFRASRLFSTVSGTGNTVPWRAPAGMTSRSVIGSHVFRSLDLNPSKRFRV